MLQNSGVQLKGLLRLLLHRVCFQIQIADVLSCLSKSVQRVRQGGLIG